MIHVYINKYATEFYYNAPETKNDRNVAHKGFELEIPHIADIIVKFSFVNPC